MSHFSLLKNYFDVLLDYYESVDFNQVLLNQIAKQLLQLLQLVNNEQIQTNILDRLKQHHDNLVEQIEHEKFAEINQSFVNNFLELFFQKDFLLFIFQDIIFEISRLSLSNIGLSTSDHNSSINSTNSIDSSCKHSHFFRLINRNLCFIRLH